MDTGYVQLACRHETEARTDKLMKETFYSLANEFMKTKQKLGGRVFYRELLRTTDHAAISYPESTGFLVSGRAPVETLG